MDDTPELESINYELLVEDALRTVVRGALSIAQHAGLPGESHFYVTFLTNASGVSIAESLKAVNPEEMTIVLQHQFWDLEVFEDKFHVTLSFSGAHQLLIIPFSAVTHFTDPSVGFGLQFSEPETGQENTPAEERTNISIDLVKPSTLTEISSLLTTSDTTDKPSKSDKSSEINKDTADVVSLDTFRKEP